MLLLQVSNTIKIKYQFSTLPFAQKIQKNVSLLRGLKQGILTPKRVGENPTKSHVRPSGFKARYFNPEGVVLL
jgi:hypothetical protein